jgi:hypothetical protein
MIIKTVAVFCLFATTALYAQTLKVNVLSLRLATKTDRARVNKAVALIGKVINQQSFRDLIKASSYTQTDSTPQEIYDSIILAQENFSGGKPHVMDLNMEMYYEEDGAIGYTNVSDPYFYMNRWVQASYTPMQTAGNIFHEWLHKLGHRHTYEWTEDRKDSVPYKLGYIVADLASDIESKGDPLAKQLMLKSFHQDCNQH